MSENLTIAQVEKRMRPGQYSRGGFLGWSESLETILIQDEQTLDNLGITHEQIADTLEKIFSFK